MADNLGFELLTVAIEPILKPFSQALGAVPGWDEKGLAYENLQARIRGTILMSLSNQAGALVLTTGNKSETSVGYSTLYGDTAGGFAVIKDVPKTLVYRLASYMNERAGRELIPDRCHHASAQRRTAARPEGRRLAARLRSARPHHQGLR